VQRKEGAWGKKEKGRVPPRGSREEGRKRKYKKKNTAERKRKEGKMLSKKKKTTWRGYPGKN